MTLLIRALPNRPRVVALLALILLISPAGGIAARDVASTPHATAPVTSITLGDEIAIDGPGAEASADGVTITAGGAYRLIGTLADGTIDVTTPDAAVELILAGASITNADGPAILFRDAASATVTLEAGTTNALADGGDTDFDAALSSDASLTIRGEGDLLVEGNQNEGIASTMHITIEGGSIRVRAVEDGLNANNDDVSEITITGGYLFVETETGDGIDSNGTITITGGTVISLGALADANGGLDADGAVTIDGGTVIATGARLALPVAESAQSSIVVTFDTTQAAGALAVIRDEAGEDLLVFAPSIDYQQLLFSDAAIAEGVTYTVFSGGAAAGEAVDGLSTAPPANPGTEITTVTTESIAEARMRGGGPPPGEGGPPPDAAPPEDVDAGA